MSDGAGDMRDSGTRARAGRMKLVACGAVIEDLGGLRPEIPREIVDMSLHERPGKLREHLQDIIDASAGSWDTLALAYGLCSQAVVGLRANGCRLVIARTDDCISMLLGSHELRQQELAAEPGTYFLTKGWLRTGAAGPLAAYAQVAARRGPERAERLVRSMMRHYTRIVFIGTGTDDVEPERMKAREMADWLGLRFVEREATTAVFEQLLDGPWDDRYVVVEPGGTVKFEDFFGAGATSSPRAEMLTAGTPTGGGEHAVGDR